MSSIYSGSSLGGSRSSLGSSTGLSGFSPPSYKAPTTVSKPSHHWYDGITGFIGHLGADIEHSVVGLPMGIVQLIEHPIGSIETMGKVEWQDWSPLFHGDLSTWEHQTFEHPLGPLLDVLSVVTLGGSLAGHVAEGAAEVGIASKTGAIARFGNPAKAVFAEHEAAGLAKGLDAEAAAKEAVKLTGQDARVHRLVTGKGGLMQYTDRYSKNPIIRAREKGIAKLGNSSVGGRTGLSRVFSDDALYRRMQRGDKGGRSAAVVQYMHKQVAALHDLGKKLTGMSNEEIFNEVHPTLRDGLEAQAHEIPLDRLPRNEDGTVNEAAFKEQMAKDNVQPLKHRDVVDNEKTLKALNKSGKDAFKNGMNVWGKDQTTVGFKDAQLNDAKDAVLVIPTSAAKGEGAQFAIGKETAHSIDVVKAMYKYPTTLWKWMVLAASPRYFVNNVVGNWLMMSMAINPVALSRAMYDHIRLTRGQRAADRAATDVGQVLHKMTGDIVEEKFAMEHGGHARSMMNEAGLQKTGFRARVRQGLYPITHIISDYIPRRAAIIATMRRTPEFQGLMAVYKRQGLNELDAFNKAFRGASESGAVRAFVRQQVNHTLGQYHSFTKTERSIQGIVPFYSWDRAITAHTAALLRSQPYKVAMVSALSNQGVKKTQDMLGQLPGFLQGVIPEDALGGPAGLLGALFGSQGKGKKNILLTQSLNPYSTAGDLANAALSVAGVAPGGQGLSLGETVGSQLNPILSGAAESLSGTSLLSGAPIKHSRGGLLGDIFSSLAESTPPVKIGEALANKYGGGYPQPAKANQPFLYSKDVRSQIGSYLGFGARQMGLDTAHQLARSERGGKKPRKISTGVPGL